MQLDPNQPFATQIDSLMGRQFENVVASALFYSGYHVDRNIILSINKETVAEIDVVATLITPLNEIRIALECKGANPSFNDLRKFATVKNLLSDTDYFVELIVFGANQTRIEHQEIASLLNIKLLKKEDLSKLVLPILWGTGELRGDRICLLNRYLAIYELEDYYLETIDKIQDKHLKKQFTHYKKYLYSDLWSIQNPIDQINDAFQKAQNEFKNFTDTIAKQLNTTALDEVRDPTNEIIQAAMFLELKHRLLNLNGIARCSILARTMQGREIISERTPAIREALNDLCDYNISVSKFMNFIYRFIFIWGGILLKEDKNIAKELNILAIETGISDESAYKFLSIFQNIYQTGNSLFLDKDKNFLMKYVPSSFRALGFIHRQYVYGPNAPKKLFNEDKQNLALLEKSLVNSGGITGLKF